MIYYRWYWKTGRRLERAEHAVARGLKSTGPHGLLDVPRPGGPRGQRLRQRRRAWTSSRQWTYSYPDPIRIAVATDELLAMAGGAAGRSR